MSDWDLPEPTDEEMPHEYTKAEVRALVEEGWSEGYGKGLMTDGGLISWNVDTFGAPHHMEVEDAIPMAWDGKEVLINPDGTMANPDAGLSDDADWEFDSKVSFDGENHELHWQPGQEGKGIIDEEGNLHTWNTQDGYPWHGDYMAENGVATAEDYFYLDYDGTILDKGQVLSPQSRRIIEQAEPRIQIPEGIDWSFESATAQSDWQPGYFGKGIVSDGNIVTWTTDQADGQPTHQQMLAGVSPEALFRIDPDGTIGIYNSAEPNVKQDDQNDVSALITKLDPRLKYTGWTHPYEEPHDQSHQQGLAPIGFS